MKLDRILLAFALVLVALGALAMFSVAAEPPLGFAQNCQNGNCPNGPTQAAAKAGAAAAVPAKFAAAGYRSMPAGPHACPCAIPQHAFHGHLAGLIRGKLHEAREKVHAVAAAILQARPQPLRNAVAALATRQPLHRLAYRITHPLRGRVRGAIRCR